MQSQKAVLASALAATICGTAFAQEAYADRGRDSSLS